MLVAAAIDNVYSITMVMAGGPSPRSLLLTMASSSCRSGIHWCFDLLQLWGQQLKMGTFFASDQPLMQLWWKT